MNKIVLLFIFTDFSNKVSKKTKKVCKVEDERFCDTEFKIFLQKNHPKNIGHSLYCALCIKGINIEHRDRADITRHINSNAHEKSQKPEKNNLELIQSF